MHETNDIRSLCESAKSHIALLQQEASTEAQLSTEGLSALRVVADIAQAVRSQFDALLPSWSDKFWFYVQTEGSPYVHLIYHANWLAWIATKPDPSLKEAQEEVNAFFTEAWECIRAAEQGNTITFDPQDQESISDPLVTKQ